MPKTTEQLLKSIARDLGKVRQQLAKQESTEHLADCITQTASAQAVIGSVQSAYFAHLRAIQFQAVEKGKRIYIL